MAPTYSSEYHVEGKRDVKVEGIVISDADNEEECNEDAVTLEGNIPCLQPKVSHKHSTLKCNEKELEKGDDVA